MKKLLITIDGPAGAGKTSASRILAERLGYNYIDTGALYRAVALNALENNIPEADDKRLQSLCNSLRLAFVRINHAQRLLVNEADVTDLIRTPEISMAASRLSANPIIRQYLLSIQRALGREKNAVFEGRDMGTVVFPDADVKFFLKASLQARARRRFEESPADKQPSLTKVEQDMAQRDDNDSNRALCPLKPAPDALVIDSTHLSLEAVVALMLDVIGKA